MQRAKNQEPRSDEGAALVLTIMSLMAILGLVAAIAVPVVANASSVFRNRAVGDARRLGEEVLGELYAHARDQHTTAMTFSSSGQVSALVSPATPASSGVVSAASWVKWDGTHTSFVACTDTTEPCFYYSTRADTSAVGATQRTVVAEVTIRTGCRLSNVDTCTYRRFQQTWNRRLISDYLMVSETDAGLYLEGQPVGVTTPVGKAIVAGYYSNPLPAPASAVAGFDTLIGAQAEDYWQVGGTVSTALTTASGGGLPPRGVFRIMTQLTLTAIGTYLIKADGDEAGRLRIIGRTTTPTFDVPVDSALVGIAPAFTSTATITTTAVNQKVLIDLMVLNNTIAVSTAGLSIKAPGALVFTAIADGNEVPMKATFDTANRAGRWFYDGPIHLNDQQWRTCGQIVLTDDAEAGSLDGNGDVFADVTPARTGCVAATSTAGFSVATAPILLPSTFPEVETAANRGGTLGIHVPAPSGIPANPVRIALSGTTATILNENNVSSTRTFASGAVIWVEGNAAEIYGNATNVTVLVDRNVTITGDLNNSADTDLGIVTKQNACVRASYNKRLIRAAVLATGAIGNETVCAPATISPGPALNGLPLLQIEGSVAAHTPVQNTDTTGSVIPQFKLPTVAWSPPFFPQAANSRWDQTGFTELTVNQGFAPRPI